MCPTIASNPDRVQAMEIVPMSCPSIVMAVVHPCLSQAVLLTPAVHDIIGCPA